MIRDLLRTAYRSALPLLYSKTNYKLFLNTALGYMDLRLQQLASVTDYFSGFVRPVPIMAPFGKSMLVIAPHQDDEAIGCGGALVAQVRAGGKGFVVLLQDGGDEHAEGGMTRGELAEMRNGESRQSAECAGIEPPTFLSHASLKADSARLAEELRSIIADRRVDAIFTPWLLDGHPDHREANYILARVLADMKWKGRVFGYEVWGLCIPNVILPIDEVIDVKLRMLKCFHYANRALDYVNTTKGLNMFRARLLAAGTCSHAECFFEAPVSEFIELVGRVQAAEGRPGRA